jgi:hypothetical protein
MICMSPGQWRVSLYWLSIHDYVWVWRYSNRHVRRAIPFLVGGTLWGKENHEGQVERLGMIEEAVHLKTDVSTQN